MGWPVLLGGHLFVNINKNKTITPTINEPQYTIYTDASCVTINDRCSIGWAVLYKKNNEHETLIAGNTRLFKKSHQGELFAVIMGMSVIPRKSHIKIYTDNKAITMIMEKLEDEKFFQSKKDSMDRILWNKLKYLFTKFQSCELIWVKGHSNIRENAIVDKIAKMCAAKNKYKPQFNKEHLKQTIQKFNLQLN